MVRFSIDFSSLHQTGKRHRYRRRYLAGAKPGYGSTLTPNWLRNGARIFLNQSGRVAASTDSKECK